MTDQCCTSSRRHHPTLAIANRFTQFGVDVVCGQCRAIGCPPGTEQSSAEAVSHLDTPRQEDIMNKIAISLAVSATALFATAATAAPLTVNPSVAPDSNIQNVRMVCNENGRCWRERGERRVIIRDSYGYDAPRERYIERRGYEERGGIGFRAPGVSVGIGTDRY
jgi:hypothetical protein